MTFWPTNSLNVMGSFSPSGDMRYDERMKSKLDPQTTPAQKFARFQGALRRVLTVSKDDLNQMLKDDEKIRREVKRKPGPKPGSSVSGRVGDSKA
jgi:hypothetical protein